MHKHECIAGIDEAGRGALAGPVVAGACVVQGICTKDRRDPPRWSPEGFPDVLIADSKALTPEQRELSFAWILAHCAVGIGIVSQEVIDTKGILHANETAMRAALAQLRQSMNVDRVLVDGNDKFSFPVPHTSIIRGDQTEVCIAAASILAKVTRDRIMIKLDTLFPVYGFASHKGYGSAEHRNAVLTHGSCCVHRQTFLQKLLSEQLALL